MKNREPAPPLMTPIDSIDWEIFDNICQWLKPIQIAASALSRRDSKILSAEGVHRFLMDQFHINQFSFSQDLKSALILERQNNIVNIYGFFLTRVIYQEYRQTIPPYPPSTVMLVKKLGEKIVHNFTFPGLMQATNLMLDELESAICESTASTDFKFLLRL